MPFIFFALSSAPPAQASLIAYLWPLFIVFLAATRHVDEPRVWVPSVLGGILGLAGTALILTDSGPADVRSTYFAGYIAALSCACIWSCYSVFNARFRETPSGMLVGVCGAVAVAGLVFTKRGHIAYLGILSYLAPLISTALLIASHQVAVTPGLLIAAGLIMGGTLVPKLAEFCPRPNPSAQDDAA